MLPPAATYLLGGAAGWIYSFLPTRSLRAARVNLELCLPELPLSGRRRLLRASFGHTARYFLELGRIWCGEAPGLPGMVRSAHGLDLLAAAHARGKGVLVMVPHLGSWEVLGAYLAARYPTTGLYRPPRVQELNDVYLRGRERHGSRLVPAGPSGVRGLRRALARGELACLLPDQDPGRGAGVFVPFFGHPANTGTLLARLAARTGAAVVTAYARRLQGGRFEVVFGEGGAEIGAADPQVGSAAVNRAVERCVREAPEQYLWSYKRFRFQPEGARSPYKPQLGAARRRSP